MLTGVVCRVGAVREGHLAQGREVEPESAGSFGRGSLTREAE